MKGRRNYHGDLGRLLRATTYHGSKARAIGVVLLLSLVLISCYAVPPRQVVEVTGTQVTVTIWNDDVSTRVVFSGTERLEARGDRMVISSPKGFSLVVLEITSKGPAPFATEQERIIQTYNARPDEEVTLTWS